MKGHITVSDLLVLDKEDGLFTDKQRAFVKKCLRKDEIVFEGKDAAALMGSSLKKIRAIVRRWADECLSLDEAETRADRYYNSIDRE